MAQTLPTRTLMAEILSCAISATTLLNYIGRKRQGGSESPPVSPLSRDLLHDWTQQHVHNMKALFRDHC